MSTNVDTIRDLAEQEYKWGFVTEIDEDRVPKGLNEETIRLISAKKGEPEFMLEWRLKASAPLGIAGTGARRSRSGRISLRADRLSGHRVLLGAQAETGSGQPGRTGPRDSAHL